MILLPGFPTLVMVLFMMVRIFLCFPHNYRSLDLATEGYGMTRDDCFYPLESNVVLPRRTMLPGVDFI
jgi:hypothetical protein